MKIAVRSLLALSLCAAPLNFVAQTAHAKPAAKAAAKTQVLTVCPIMQHEVPKDEANSQKVGNVKAYFCCSGCKAKFNKMTAAQKKANLQAAMKKQKKA